MSARRIRLLTSLAVCLAVSLSAGIPLGTSSAATGAARAVAVERVIDGGFEANTCPDIDWDRCRNPYWTFRPATPNQQVYFCRPSLCPGLPAAGSGWLQLGGNSVTSPSAMTVHAAQTVNIPAAEATLSFAYRFHRLSEEPYAVGPDSLTVSIDGMPVMSTSGGPAAYTTPVIALSGLTAGSHVLKFEASCSRTPGQPCGAYEIDSVSIVSADDAACAQARQKLATKKATLRKLQKHDAAAERINKAKRKVKKAKRAVRAVCPA
jgi:hypothetical protein